MKYIVFLLLIVHLGVASSHDVYRWVAPDGITYYSDQPHTGAERIVLPESPPPRPTRPVTMPPPAATKPVFFTYNNLTIAKPASEENIFDNQGNIEVTVTIKPDLNTSESHKIQILLDGQAQGEPSTSLELSLSGIERGKHTLTAQVVNERGRVLIKSRPVIFYLKHASPLFHPPRPDVPQRGVQQAPRAPMAPRAPRAPHAPFRPATPYPSPTQPSK
jgi:hypothetical protein